MSEEQHQFQPTVYSLKTVADMSDVQEDGWTLENKQCSTPSLVRAYYQNQHLIPYPDSFGIYKFGSWLPISRMLQGSGAPITYKSEGLAQRIGLNNLYVTFSGYWPEKGAAMLSCSFKETEAFSVLARIPERLSNKIIVVQSAGNTARAFARVCSENNIPLLLCVPYDNKNALWYDRPHNSCVKLVCTEAGTDYFDAIRLGNIVCKSEHFYAEGGAKNVARRDGMATTMLSATLEIGKIPDFYFQAIGSGTGAIAAWEANERLIKDGRFGNHKTRLMLSQNTPYLPMYNAWQKHERNIEVYTEEDSRRRAGEIVAKVLSNRNPPYSIAGGLYDALDATNGTIYAVTNEEANAAQLLFKEAEGIDIHPAAAVATASLIQAKEKGDIKPDDVVMLNITGGGEEMFARSHELHYLEPSIVFKKDAPDEEIISSVEKLFGF